MTNPSEHLIDDFLERATVSLADEQVSDSPPAYIVASTIETLRSIEEDTRSTPKRPISRWWEHSP